MSDNLLPNYISVMLCISWPISNCRMMEGVYLLEGAYRSIPGTEWMRIFGGRQLSQSSISFSIRANLNRDTNYFLLYLQKKMNLYRDTFHKYISVMAKQLAVFFMSLQTCASDSAKIFAMCASIIQRVWQLSLLYWQWQINRKNLTVGMSLTILI
jgi:hypothetical protein